MTPPARSTRAARAKGGQRGPTFRTAEPAPLVFLDGADDYQAARAFEIIRNKAREANESIDVTRIDGESYEPSQLILASSPSLFGGAPLIEIHGLEKMNEALQKDLLNYLEAPQDDAIVVLHHSGGQRGKSLVNILKKRASVIDVSPLKKDQERQDFVLGEFKALRRKADPEAVRALVDSVGSDVAELGAAVSQLVSDVDGPITVDAVTTYFGGRLETTGFAVADAAVAGRGAEAVSLLRYALASGLDPVPLLAAIGGKVRQIAKVAGNSAPAGQLASELGMAPWMIKQAQASSRRFSPTNISKAVQLIATTDHMLKGASRNPEYALERCVIAISRMAAAGPRAS